jgi:hypothetical protein
MKTYSSANIEVDLKYCHKCEGMRLIVHLVCAECKTAINEMDRRKWDRRNMDRPDRDKRYEDRAINKGRRENKRRK